MKKVTFALDIINRMRREKSPPLARYCIVLALAENGNPLTSRQIADRLREEFPITGALDHACRSCLVEKLPTRPATYRITTEGQAMAAALLTISTDTTTSPA